MAYYESFTLKTVDRKLLSVLNLEMSQLFFSTTFILPSVTHLNRVALQPRGGGEGAWTSPGVTPKSNRWHSAHLRSTIGIWLRVIKHRVTNGPRQHTK